MSEAEIVASSFYIGDTETCGLPPHHYPCQIGLMQIDPVSFDVLWEIESLIDPEYPIGEIASGIHGITDDMVADEPTLAEFIEHRLDGGLKGEITMIAHNFQFDAKALSQLGTITRSICSLFEARQNVSLFPGLQDCKLQTLRAYFGIAEDNAHQALGDCNVTRQVLKKICEASGRSLEQLATLKDRVVHVMPWGKHKGKLIPTIPKSDIAWLLGLENLEPNLRASLQKAYDLKR